MKITLFITLFFSLIIYAQPLVLPENGSLMSVQLFNTSQKNLSPFIKLNESLSLSFDVIGNSYDVYSYKIEHYNANWEKSNIPFNQYITGLRTPRFEPPKTSFNTRVLYSHYETTIPNKDQEILVSGNYIISVYKGTDHEPVFTRKFAVYENSSVVELSWQRNITDSINNQRILVKAKAGSLDQDMNPQNYKLTILKNDNWANASQGIQPDFFTSNVFQYQSLDLVYPGGNEYLTFDTKVVNSTSFYIDKVKETPAAYSLFIRPYDSSTNTSYINIPDLDGQFFFRSLNINQLQDQSPNLSGDYALMRFQLIYPKSNQKIFVVGMFNNWQPTEAFQLKYDDNTNLWVCDAWLKQGYYNYQYAVLESNETLNTDPIHGSFWETENKYSALLYYRPIGQFYDKLIGLGEIDTNR